jgi:hypothetical protein
MHKKIQQKKIKKKNTAKKYHSNKDLGFFVVF